MTRWAFATVVTNFPFFLCIGSPIYRLKHFLLLSLHFFLNTWSLVFLDKKLDLPSVLNIPNLWLPFDIPGPIWAFSWLSSLIFTPRYANFLLRTIPYYPSIGYLYIASCILVIFPSSSNLLLSSLPPKHPS